MYHQNEYVNSSILTICGQFLAYGKTMQLICEKHYVKNNCGRVIFQVENVGHWPVSFKLKCQSSKVVFSTHCLYTPASWFIHRWQGRITRGRDGGFREERFEPPFPAYFLSPKNFFEKFVVNAYFFALNVALRHKKNLKCLKSKTLLVQFPSIGTILRKIR